MDHTNLFEMKFYWLIMAKVDTFPNHIRNIFRGFKINLNSNGLVPTPKPVHHLTEARNPIKTYLFKICIRETDVGLGLFVCSCKHFKRTNYISDVENYKMYP